MDEASSRFVDRLAVEKLLGEKLSTVHHQPKTRPEELLDSTFERYRQPLDIPVVSQGESPWVSNVLSPVSCTYPENRSFRLLAYPAKAQRGVLLLVHGLFEDNRNIYRFFIGELVRLGYSVYMTTLPFHYERRPNGSRFSGELFLSADLKRTREAFYQAVLEVRQCHAWITKQHGGSVYTVGFSIGGSVALAAAGATDSLDGLCIINPAAALSQLVWKSPLFQTIRADLETAGWREADVRRVLATFDPFTLTHCAFSTEKLLMLFGLYDQVTLPEHYDALIARWGLLNVIRYKAGHLNTLRVPRLAEDIARFCDELAKTNTCSTQGGAF